MRSLTKDRKRFSLELPEKKQASQVALLIKNLLANAGDIRDTGLTPGSGRSPGATHSTILAWKIPWTEEPGRPQFMASQRVRHDRTALLMLLSAQAS